MNVLGVSTFRQLTSTLSTSTAATGCMAVHTIGPFIGTHEILRTRRAAIRKAAEYSVPYPQGESLLNVSQGRTIRRRSALLRVGPTVSSRICRLGTRRTLYGHGDLRSRTSGHKRLRRDGLSPRQGAQLGGGQIMMPAVEQARTASWFRRFVREHKQNGDRLSQQPYGGVGPSNKVCLRCRVPSAIGLSFERSW